MVSGWDHLLKQIFVTESGDQSPSVSQRKAAFHGAS